MYDLGEGVTQDYTEALKWYTLAAEKGDAFAQSNLGVMYEVGNGVAVDYKKAMEWYSKSADNGHAIAQRNLGLLYHQGLGVEKDITKAYACYAIAAANGDIKAANWRNEIKLSFRQSERADMFIKASIGETPVREETEKAISQIFPETLNTEIPNIPIGSRQISVNSI